MSRDMQQMIPIALVTGLFIAGGIDVLYRVIIPFAGGVLAGIAILALRALLGQLPTAWRHARRLRRRLACALTHHRWTAATQVLGGTPALYQLRLACDRCDEVHVFGLTLHVMDAGATRYEGPPGNW